jgi:Trypsin
MGRAREGGHTVRKLLLLCAAVTGALAIGLVPAGAVTNNYVDDFEHPFVGLVVFYDEEGEFSHRCSGSLLTDVVFLTAGHCTDGASSARVYFQQDAGANFNGTIDPITGYPEFCANGTLGTLCATSDELYNYGFDDFAEFPDIKDAGLVILDQRISMPEYGQLAASGTLDELHERRGLADAIFTVSGYGLSYSSPVAVVSFRSRLMAESKLVNVKAGLNQGFNVQTNGNGKDRGGTCSGDSGGPVFLGGFSSNLITAVTSFGLNEWCRGTDFGFRTDTQLVLDWILDTVPRNEVDEIQIVG